MYLKIKAFSAEIHKMYINHGHFHEGDAGLDVFITEEQTIIAGESTLIHLKIACESQDGRPYLLLPRSSIAQTPLRLSNSIGLIDGGYRGEIIAAVDNIKNRDYTVSKGQRLFQIVGMDGSPIHYEIVDTLSDTSRGAGGFGSTGN